MHETRIYIIKETTIHEQPKKYNRHRRRCRRYDRGYCSSKEGCAVSLYEKNEKLGKKIFITGKGRCNVTNAGDMDELFAAVITNKKFMFSSFYGFTNEDMMQFLEDAGLRLKTERGKRVFPLSDHSSDVIAALDRTLKKENVKVYLRKEVKGLNFITEEDKTICKGLSWKKMEKRQLWMRIASS